MQAIFLVYGNCQAKVIERILLGSEPFARSFGKVANIRPGMRDLVSTPVDSIFDMIYVIIGVEYAYS